MPMQHNAKHGSPRNDSAEPGDHHAAAAPEQLPIGDTAVPGPAQASPGGTSLLQNAVAYASVLAVLITIFIFVHENRLAAERRGYEADLAAIEDTCNTKQKALAERIAEARDELRGLRSLVLSTRSHMDDVSETVLEQVDERRKAVQAIVNEIAKDFRAASLDADKREDVGPKLLELIQEYTQSHKETLQKYRELYEALLASLDGLTTAGEESISTAEEKSEELEKLIAEIRKKLDQLPKKVLTGTHVDASGLQEELRKTEAKLASLTEKEEELRLLVKRASRLKTQAAHLADRTAN